MSRLPDRELEKLSREELIAQCVHLDAARQAANNHQDRLQTALAARDAEIKRLRSSLQYLFDAYRYQHSPQHRTAARNEAFAVLAQPKEPT
jgi:hypothetical protein